jgi:hypothetical protein
MTVPARGSSLHRGQPDVPYYYGGERPELLAVVPRDRRRVLELGCGGVCVGIPEDQQRGRVLGRGAVSRGGGRSPPAPLPDVRPPRGASLRRRHGPDDESSSPGGRRSLGKPGGGSHGAGLTAPAARGVLAVDTPERPGSSQCPPPEPHPGPRDVVGPSAGRPAVRNDAQAVGRRARRSGAAGARSPPAGGHRIAGITSWVRRRSVRRIWSMESRPPGFSSAMIPSSPRSSRRRPRRPARPAGVPNATRVSRIRS